MNKPKEYEYELLTLEVERVENEDRVILKAQVQFPEEKDKKRVPLYDPEPFFFLLSFPLSGTQLPDLYTLAKDFQKIVQQFWQDNA